MRKFRKVVCPECKFNFTDADVIEGVTIQTVKERIYCPYCIRWYRFDELERIILELSNGI